MSLLVQPNTYQVETEFPLDDRIVVADETARLSIVFRYTGLVVFQLDTQIQYACTDAGTNTWIPLGSGSAFGKKISNNEYDDTTGTVTPVDLPDQPELRFGQEFKISDDPINLETVIENIIYAPDIDGGISSPGVGGIDAGTLVSDLRGLSVTDIINRIVFPVIPPTYIDPTGSISGTLPTTIKVGTSTPVDITSSFIQNDAGTLTQYSLEQDSVQVDIDTAPAVSTFIYSDTILFNSPDSTVFQAFFNYDEGPLKDDNYGNPSGDPPGPGTLSTTTLAYTAIYPYFYGINTSKSVTQTEINAGTEVIQSPGNNLIIDWGAQGIIYYWFAVPQGSPVYIAWEDTNDPNNAGPIGGGELFEPIGTFNFNDPDGGFANIPYDVYITGFQTELLAPFKFTA